VFSQFPPPGTSTYLLDPQKNIKRSKHRTNFFPCAPSIYRLRRTLKQQHDTSGRRANREQRTKPRSPPLTQILTRTYTSATIQTHTAGVEQQATFYCCCFQRTTNKTNNAHTHAECFWVRETATARYEMQRYRYKGGGVRWGGLDEGIETAQTNKICCTVSRMLHVD